MKFAGGATYILFIALVFSAQMVFARTRPPIKIQGLSSAEVRDLKRKFPGIDKPNFPLYSVDRVVRHLMNKNRYTSVIVTKANPKSKTLILKAKLIKRIGQINITGQNRFSRKKVTEVLGINPNDILRTDEIEESAKKLNGQYEQEGYFNSRVKLSYSSQSSALTNLNIEIDEGEPCRIVDIQFKTTNKRLARRLGRLGERLISEVFSNSKLSRLQSRINNYFAENRFLTSRISEPEVNFNATKSQAKIVYAVEDPYSYEFLLNGNYSLEDRVLIKGFDLSKTSGLTFSPSTQLLQSLKDQYLAAGYPNIDVKFKEETLEDRFIRQIIFNIDENPKVRIRSIRVEGKTSRSSDYYSKIIEANSGPLIRKNFYNKKLIEKGAKSLIDVLQNQGFLRAEVLSIRPQFDKKKKVVDVFVNLDEGPLTQVQKIRFLNAKAFSSLRLQEVIGIKTNQPLRLDTLQKSIEKIKAFYRSYGYLEAQVLNERKDLVKYNQNYTLATLNYKIREGPIVKVNSIIVDGNTFTKDDVVIRELEFSEGDTLTPFILQESVSRLQRLGLFSRVQIGTLEDGSNVSERTVRVSVTERDPGLFSLGFGLTNEQQFSYRGFTGLAYRNLYGTGRKVFSRLDIQYSTDPDVSYLENEITLSYLEPAVLSDRTQLRVNLIRSEDALDPETGDINITIQEKNEINLLLEKEFSRTVKGTWNLYTFSNQRFFDRVTRADERTINIGSVGPILEVDLRDSLTVPSQGSYTRMALEYSDPVLGSSEDEFKYLKFIRATAAYNYYLRLGSPKWVWYNSFQGGYVASLNRDGRSGVPGKKAFFLGGRSTIRGFDLSKAERIPRLTTLGADEIDDFFLQKDSHYYLIKSELRFPIYGIVGGTLFYDGGAVLVTGFEFDDPYRDAIGLGVRFIIPAVGSINVEFGYKLDRYRDLSIQNNDLNESEYAIHFSFSTF